MKASKKPTKPADWLIGTWRSDKKRTVNGWGKHPPGSPKFRRMFISDLGKMTVSFGPKLSRTRFKKVVYRAPYRVVWQSSDAVFVVRGRRGRDESGQLINFKSPDLYWVHCGRFVEFFAKVHKPQGVLKGRRAKRGH